VTASFDVEPVDIIAADAGRDIGAYLLHVEAERRNFIVIENNRRSGLVDLRIDVADLETVRLHRISENLLSEIKNPFLHGGRGDDPKDHALILCRRQCLRRKIRNYRKHKDRKERNAGTENVNRGPRIQRPIEMTSVPIPETVERAINQAAESFVYVAGAQKIC